MHPPTAGLPAATRNRTVGAPCSPRQTAHGTFGSGRYRGAADRAADPHPAHFGPTCTISQLARLLAATPWCSLPSTADSPIGVSPEREARRLLHPCHTTPTEAQLRDRTAPAPG